jgi:hypothetical protein
MTQCLMLVILVVHVWCIFWHFLVEHQFRMPFEGLAYAFEESRPSGCLVEFVPLIFYPKESPVK